MIRPGDRVKLNALGVNAILGEIIRGRLRHPMRRRSCNNRKLTEFSVGTALGIIERDDRSPCVRVKFDEMSVERTIALRFLRKTLRVLHP